MAKAIKMKPILDTLETRVINRGKVLDWSDFRDMIDVATGSELSASKLDTATQQLVNRFHKKAPHLLAR